MHEYCKSFVLSLILTDKQILLGMHNRGWKGREEDELNAHRSEYGRDLDDCMIIFHFTYSGLSIIFSTSHYN